MIPRVELDCEPNGAFFPFFVLGRSTLGGTDVLAPVSVTRSLTGVTYTTVRRGRNYATDEFRPGTATVTIDDAYREFDPLNEGSTFYGSIEPGKTLRVIVEVGGVDYTLFTGFTQRWPRDTSRRVPVATCEASDALGVLALQPLDEIAAAHNGDLSGARLERLLDLDEVNVGASMRNIDDGASFLGDTTFTEAGGIAGRYAQLVAASEQGAFFATVDNVLRFVGRRTSPGVSQALFSDDGDPGSIRYEEIEQDFDNTLLFSRVKASGTSGTVVVAEDGVARQAYQVRTLDRTGQLLSSDAEVATQAAALLERYKRPSYPLRQITVDLSTLDAGDQATVLGLELRQLVTVEHTPEVGADQIVQVSFVEGVEFRIDNRTLRVTAIIDISQATSDRIGFVLGDSTYGVLGVSKLGY